MTLQPKMAGIVGCRLRTVQPPGAIAQVARFGNPVLIEPRLGQGAFRVAVTDAYERRSAQPTVHKFTAPLPRHRVRRPVPSPLVDWQRGKSDLLS